MQLSKIKEGKYVNYQSRKLSGRAKVVSIHKAFNGHWVVVYDKTIDKTLTIRPSQII